MKRLFPALVTLALLLNFGSAMAAKIEPGFDLLKTKEGELTLKSLKGKAITPLNIGLKTKPVKKNTNKKFGNTDKILQRKKIIPGKKDTIIEVELVHLSLKSVAPVKINNNKYNAFVMLNKNKNPSTNKKKRSKGQFEIKPDAIKKGGGAFLMTLNNLFLQIDFIPISPNLDEFSEFIDVGPLSSSAGSWSDQSDSFYPTIPNLPAGNFFIRDFSLGDDTDPFFLRSIVAASVPVPATLLLIGGGLLLIGCARKRDPMT